MTDCLTQHCDVKPQGPCDTARSRFLCSLYSQAGLIGGSTVPSIALLDHVQAQTLRLSILARLKPSMPCKAGRGKWRCVCLRCRLRLCGHSW